MKTLCLLALFIITPRAAETNTIPSLTIGTNIYKNVRLLSAKTNLFVFSTPTGFVKAEPDQISEPLRSEWLAIANKPAKKSTNAPPPAPQGLTLDQQIAYSERLYKKAQEVEKDTEKLFYNAPSQAQKKSLIPLLEKRRAETQQAAKRLSILQHQRHALEMKRKGSL